MQIWCDYYMITQYILVARSTLKNCCKSLLIFSLTQNNKGKGRLKYLLQQTELFAHFAKPDQSASQKKAKGRY